MNYTPEQVREMTRHDFERAIGLLNTQIAGTFAELQRYGGRRGKDAARAHSALLEQKKRLLDGYVLCGNTTRDAALTA